MLYNKWSISELSAAVEFIQTSRNTLRVKMLEIAQTFRQNVLVRGKRDTKYEHNHNLIFITNYYHQLNCQIDGSR